MLSLNCCKFKQERFMPASILQRFMENDQEININPAISPVLTPIAQDRNIRISMLRLDQVHPIVSGNKLFKLKFYLEEAIQSKHKTLLTFGGAYSNHLAATAYAAKVLNIRSVGIIRGEAPAELSDTLIFCERQGMKLDFISRELYKQIAPLEINASLKAKYGDHLLIPEGGFSIKGKLGASVIPEFYSAFDYSHICVAIGTATTLAGILENSKPATTVLGFPALKGLADIPERLQQLKTATDGNLELIDDYHFGGFGKKTPELLRFMNQFYCDNKIPLDIVYTGKMMFGVHDLLEKKYFPVGSDILCIHTGGLQGNSSIKDLLVY